MPIFERSLLRFVSLALIDCPFTTRSPSWNGSSPFTHLMSVDLPEPDGPHTTTTSPLSTFVEQFLSTWKAPYHLLTLLNSIISSLNARSRCAAEAPSPHTTARTRWRNTPRRRRYTS